MELGQKLQELRKSRGLTQEQLAAALFVSRTAVSKWESGRGTPNIESLKAIAAYFSVSVDTLLSGEELLNLAGKETKTRVQAFKSVAFGLLDCSFVLLLLLPLLAQRGGNAVFAVTLPALTGILPAIKTAYFVLALGAVITGVVTLALQHVKTGFWARGKYKISVLLNLALVVCFMATLQPYAALFAFTFLVVKFFLLLKWQ